MTTLSEIDTLMALIIKLKEMMKIVAKEHLALSPDWTFKCFSY
jgi:hypothetical protein